MAVSPVAIYSTWRFVGCLKTFDLCYKSAREARMQVSRLDNIVIYDCSRLLDIRILTETCVCYELNCTLSQQMEVSNQSHIASVSRI